MKKNNIWFSMIEIIIWIFIFTMWLVSVFALINHSIKLNRYSNNSIIATNLARESIELIKNQRDLNFFNTKLWTSNIADLNIWEEKQYIIKQNNWNIEIIQNNENKPYLYLEDNKYLHSNNSSLKKSPFYRYIKIKKTNKDTLKLISTVWWLDKKVSLTTILTNWYKI